MARRKRKSKSKSESKPRSLRGYVVVGRKVYKVTKRGTKLMKEFQSAEEAEKRAAELGKRYKVPVVFTTGHGPVGSSVKKLDKLRKALPPGRRVSRSGKVYYEYRRNRSDTMFGWT